MQAHLGGILDIFMLTNTTDSLDYEPISFESGGLSHDNMGQVGRTGGQQDCSQNRQPAFELQ